MSRDHRPRPMPTIAAPAGALSFLSRRRPARRSRLGAWWHGRRAEAAGVPLAEYLRERLHRYLKTAPPWLPELLGRVELSADHQLILDRTATTPHPAESCLPSPDAGRESFENQVRATQATSVAEAEAQRERMARAREELARADQALAEARSALAARRAEATEADDPGPRPRLPHTGRLLLLRALCVLCLVSESWQLGVPYLNLVGVDSTALSSELARDPTSVVLGACFALGATISFFLLFHWNLQLAESIFRWRGQEPRARLGLRIVGWLGLSALLLATAAGIGDLREGLAVASAGYFDQRAGTPAGGTPAGDLPDLRLVFDLLTLLLPLAVAWSALAFGAEIDRSRTEARRRRADWWVAASARRARAECRRDAIRRAAQELERRRSGRDRALRAVDRLRSRVQQVERALRHGIARERRYATAWGQAARAALELDRFCYLMASGRRQARRARAQRLAHISRRITRTIARRISHFTPTRRTDDALSDAC